MARPSFSALSADAIEALAEALGSSGFDGSLLGRAENVAPRMLDPLRLPVVHAWLRAQKGAGPIFARLFAYDDAVEEDQLRQALGSDLLDSLARAAFIAREVEGWRSSIRVVPFGKSFIASDPMEAEGDPVMGPGATTMELLAAMPVPQGGRVLDVGTGAGSLAICAAKAGAERVVGVDLHPRATEIARFNAALNRVTLDVRTGDLTAPTAGERFDLVVAQPPFVVKPPQVEATTYLHGGERGDELTLRLLAQLPATLANGGRALVLFDTLDDPGTATRRIASALGSAPLRVLAVATPGLDAERLAIGYAAIAHPQLGPAYRAAAREYYEHLRRLGATRVHHILVDIRYDPTARLAFAVTIDRASLQGFDAGMLLRTEAAVDLAAESDGVLLDARLVVSPGTWLEQANALDRDEAILRARFDDPGRDPRALSDAAVVVLEILRQPATGRTALEAYADAAEATVAEIQAPVLQFIRSALASGLLVPA